MGVIEIVVLIACPTCPNIDFFLPFPQTPPILSWPVLGGGFESGVDVVLAGAPRDCISKCVVAVLWRVTVSIVVRYILTMFPSEGPLGLF